MLRIRYQITQDINSGHLRRMNDEKLPRKIWNDIRLKEEEREDSEIPECRKKEVE